VFRRRDLLVAATALPVLPAMARAAEGQAVLTIHSPAPPANPMHVLNRAFVDAVSARAGIGPVAMEAVALPDSVNRIAAMPDAERRRTLPIVTTVDFRDARAGGGVDWHRYDRPSPTLRWLATLYDVGFGIQTGRPDIRTPADLRGRRIGVPPRPSAVRLMAETLLNTGWGVEGAILDDMPADHAAAALRDGSIDATAWNLVLPIGGVVRPMLAEGLAGLEMRYLGIDGTVVDRLNRAHGFGLGLFDIGIEGGGLLSFAQGLAAWDDSDPALLHALLDLIAADGGRLFGHADPRTAMGLWPDLTAPETHVAARSYHRCATVRPPA
jgi:hypothetical protein